jgi:hypothetical protein
MPSLPDSNRANRPGGQVDVLLPIMSGMTPGARRRANRDGRRGNGGSFLY